MHFPQANGRIRTQDWVCSLQPNQQKVNLLEALRKATDFQKVSQGTGNQMNYPTPTIFLGPNIWVEGCPFFLVGFKGKPKGKPPCLGFQPQKTTSGCSNERPSNTKDQIFFSRKAELVYFGGSERPSNRRKNSTRSSWCGSGISNRHFPAEKSQNAPTSA